MLPVASDCIIDCLQYKTHFSGSTAELNYLESFEANLLDLWLLISQFTLSAKDSPDVQTYLNGNATFLLLQQVTDYLRKELQVPQYSAMFEDQKEFDEDTERLFTESHGQLELKIGKLKEAVGKLYEVIASNPDIKVSFPVFEGIKSLAENDIRAYRGLRVLKEIKSSFVPSFSDNTTEELVEEEKK